MLRAEEREREREIESEREIGRESRGDRERKERESRVGSRGERKIFFCEVHTSLILKFA